MTSDMNPVRDHHDTMNAQRIRLTGAGIENEGSAYRDGWDIFLDDDAATVLSSVEQVDDYLLTYERTQRDRGQGLAEYALILALIALVSIVVLATLGTQIAAALNEVATCLSDPTAAICQ